MKRRIFIHLFLILFIFHINSLVFAEDLLNDNQNTDEIPVGDSDIFNSDSFNIPNNTDDSDNSDDSDESDNTDDSDNSDDSDESENSIPLIFINEILADPSESDAENEFIELYNAGTQSVDLSHWDIYDARLKHYSFDNDSLNYHLEAGAYMVLFRPETHIILNNDTETLTLLDSSGNQIDFISFNSPGSGKSWGRNFSQFDQWLPFKTPSPASINLVEENHPPTAIIRSQHDTAHMKLNLTGEDSLDSDGDSLTFLWEFEEGSTDTRENPLAYTYQTSGEKHIHLTVTDPFGLSSETEFIFVASQKEESDPNPPDDSDSSDDSDSNPPLILINEILADPSESDAENEFIELYNAGTQSVDLSHWDIYDARLKHYSFDNDSLNYHLEAGAYMVLFRPETHIILNNDTETLTLLDSSGNQIDFISFNSPGSGKSWGRNFSQFDQWFSFKTPSPASVNLMEENHPPTAIIRSQHDTAYMKLNLTGEDSMDSDGDSLTFLWELEEGSTDTRENPLAYTYQTSGEKHIHLTVTDPFGLSSEAEFIFVAKQKDSDDSDSSDDADNILKHYDSYSLINEIIPNPVGKDSDGEWVELFNPYDFPIDLSFWYLDDSEGKSRPFKIPDGTIIGSNDYLLFSEPDLKLSFKNSQDSVRLLFPNKGVSQEVIYSDAKEGFSFAKTASNNFEWTPNLSPNAINIFPTPPKTYAYSSVVFESVLPNPKGKDSNQEKIILKNKSSEDISLLNWSISDATDKKKKLSDMVISSQNTLLLTSSDFKLSLNNSNERLQLFDPSEKLIDHIEWKRSLSGRWLFNPNSLPNGMEARVVRVVDGDTIIIQFKHKKLTVRLLGIDTPETVHPFKPVQYYGKQASNFLSNLLSNSSVRLEFDENKIDKYGRVLAYVYLNDDMVNMRLLKDGYAYAYTRFPFKYHDLFVSLESEARNARIGLWQNLKVKKLIDEIIEDESLTDELNEDFLEEDLLILEDDSDELVSEEDKIEKIDVNNYNNKDLNSHLDSCFSTASSLKIHHFLPNNKKGESLEYIQLINIGNQKVCLKDWVLDDVIDAGSKPFVIRGGSIASGAKRTFRKNETKLVLNNKNDCVSLISPQSDLLDQICYKKTHKNEVFTHDGGDWIPKKRKKGRSKRYKKKKIARYHFGRDFISYSSDLLSHSYEGHLDAIDEKSKTISLNLQNGNNIKISYAHSPVDIATTKQLISFSDTVKVQVYEVGETKNLLSIDILNQSIDSLPADSNMNDFITLFLLVFIFTTSFVFYRYYR